MTDDQGLPLAGAIALAAIALGAAAQGGFFPGALAAVTALALLAAGLAGRPRIGSFEAACLAFAAWAVVAGALGASVTAAVSTVAVCVAMASVASVLGRFDISDRLGIVNGISTVGAIVALSGIVGVATQTEPIAIASQKLWRAATSITYANASASFLAITTLLSLAAVIDRADRKRVAVATVSLAGLLATMSRAGIAAAVVGAIVMLVIARRALPVVPVGLGALVIVGSLIPSMLEDGPARPLIAAVGFVVGLGVAVVASAASPRVLVAVVVAGVVGVGAVAMANPSTLDKAVSKRLTLASSARAESMKAALRVVAADPMTGAGPGRAPLIWRSPDGDSLLVAQFVHNEYLQILADMGVPGGLLLLWLLFVAATTIRRGRARLPRPVWGAIVGGVVALSLHANFDFLFHVPVIPLTAAALVGICAFGEADVTTDTVSADGQGEA